MKRTCTTWHVLWSMVMKQSTRYVLSKWSKISFCISWMCWQFTDNREVHLLSLLLIWLVFLTWVLTTALLFTNKLKSLSYISRWCTYLIFFIHKKRFDKNTFTKYSESYQIIFDFLKNKSRVNILYETKSTYLLWWNDGHRTMWRTRYLKRRIVLILLLGGGFIFFLSSKLSKVSCIVSQF